MRKSIVVAVHIGFWVCYLMLVFVMLGIYYRTILNVSNPQYRIMNAFNSVFIFAFIPSFICYWLYYLFLFPRYLQQKKILSSIVYGVLIAVLAAVASYILLRFMIETGRIMDMDEGGKHGRSTAGRTIMVMTVIGGICGGVAMVIKGFITWYNEIKLKEMLTEKNHAMEMALVRSQLDPHLLFNTINNIDTLILRSPEVASNYLNKLSDILRFVLYETKGDSIPLAQEISYIEKYIDLQKIRTSNEAYVQFEVSGSAAGKSIAPMVFIPFIENAFKHTNNKKVERAILIKISIEDQKVNLLCENKYDSKLIKSTNNGGGLGNELVQKRLDLIYKGRHTLSVHNQDDLYSVKLTVPCE